MNELPPPTIKDTALFRAPVWAYNKTVGRLLNKAPVEEEEFDDEVEAGDAPSTDEADDFEILEKVKTTAQNGSSKAAKKSKKSVRGR